MTAEKLLNKNFIMLCLCNLFFCVSFFMSLPVLPLYLTEVLGTSKSLAGFMVAIYAFAALILRPFSGAIVDSYQRRTVFLLFMALIVVASSCYIFIVNLVLFGMLRFGHGMIFSITGTSLNTVVVDNIPPTKMGSGIGIFGVIISLGMALGPMLGIMILDRFSYTMVFIISTFWACAALATAVMVSTPARAIEERTGPLLDPDKLFLKKGAIAAVTFILTVFSYGLLTNYISLLAKERGIESSAGLFFCCLAVGLMLSRIFSGWFLDKGHLLKIIIAGKLIVMAAFVYFLSVGGNTAFLTAGIFLGLGFGMCMPAYQTLFLALALKDQVGTANSTYLFSFDGGIGLAALTGGMIADMTSLNFMYGFGACLVLLALVVFVLTTGKTRRQAVRT